MGSRLAQSPPRRCPAIQEGFFIDGLGRCFSVRDVLLSRLRDILSLSPHGPTDIWPTSKAYFEHFATRKPLREGLRYSEWASACENARKPAKAFHKKHPFFDPESPYLRGQYPDTFVISIPEAGKERSSPMISNCSAMCPSIGPRALETQGVILFSRRKSCRQRSGCRVY